MNIRPLCKELQEKVEKELHEDPAQIQQNLDLFKNWLKKQQHLKYKNDDQFLLGFLRSSKYSLERAKKKLDAFYTFRTYAPEAARDYDPFLPGTQSHLSLTCSVPLPTSKDDPAGPRVMLVRYGDYNPDEVPASTILNGESMAINLLMNIDDNFVVSGAIYVFDFSGIKIKTALQSTPALVKKVAICFEKALPTRLKASYVINVPTYFEAVVNLIKLLVSKKIAKRMHVYSTNNLEEIFKKIPRSHFPKEYGGNAGCYDDLRATWKKTVESYREMLLNEREYYSEESKRPEEVDVVGDVFGMDGTFKNLQID